MVSIPTWTSTMNLIPGTQLLGRCNLSVTGYALFCCGLGIVEGDGLDAGHDTGKDMDLEHVYSNSIFGLQLGSVPTPLKLTEVPSLFVTQVCPVLCGIIILRIVVLV